MTYAAKTTFNAQPNWLRIVSVIGILWYIFGSSQFLKNITTDVATAVASGEITAAHGAALTATPLFVWAAYGIACILGIVGAIQLFRGHANAWKIFAVSLLLDVIYFGWFHVSGYASARPTEAGPIAILVLTIATFYTMLSFRKA